MNRIPLLKATQEADRPEAALRSGHAGWWKRGLGAAGSGGGMVAGGLGGTSTGGPTGTGNLGGGGGIGGDPTHGLGGTTDTVRRDEEATPGAGSGPGAQRKYT